MIKIQTSCKSIKNLIILHKIKNINKNAVVTSINSFSNSSRYFRQQYGLKALNLKSNNSLNKCTVELTKKFYSSNNNNNNSNNNNSNKQKKEDEIREEDTVENLSKELLQFDKLTTNKKDWPLNSEVIIYPSLSTHFIGAKGPVNLPNIFSDKMIPNSSGKTYIGLFLVKEQFRNATDPTLIKSADAVHHIGVLAQVSYSPLGYYMFEIQSRIRIKSISNNSYPFMAQIEPYLPNEVEDDPRIPELTKKIDELVKNFQKLYPDSYTLLKSSDFLKQIQSLKPSGYPTAIMNYYGLNYPDQCQLILETDSIVDRLDKMYQLLLKEEKLLSIQQNIYREIEEKKSKDQKKFFLNEQLKKIKSQLGVDQDEKEQIIQKYQNKLATLLVDETQRKIIQDEINKLSTIDPSSMEYNSSRNYLDWLTNLPWKKYSEEFFDLQHSKEVLDKDHFGLNDIKQRILEFISIGHLKGSVMGKIICFVGPPGTGKTSIAKSIATCLKREFYRFSVGGLFDEGEIKGHRRTYIGSMPGKLIQCMKLVQTSNPVILIDEIDKIGKRNLGDPSSALLEVLDPEQNCTFVDHYLDVPYDLSRVLFICTANSDQTIPGPLFDRMEVIYLSGYVEEEQIQIVRNFIVPKTLRECGITSEQLTISDDVIKQLVKFYSREVGIRELERLIEKIMRKSALMLVNGQKSVHIDLNNLEEFLGIPTYSSDRYYDVTPVGVVNGLAWSQRGGSTLYIETTAQQNNNSQNKTTKSKNSNGGNAPRLRTTGKLGDVMTESSSIAYTYAKNFLLMIQPENKFFEENSLHMHAPQGGISKDGPSAGVTMVTSLLSLAMNEPVLNNLGMTGEITITGKVYTIGGVKEKTIAAKRSGLTCIVIPSNNKFDFEELPQYIKNDIDIKYAKEYKDVFEIAFPNKKHLLQNII
ncbi:peptidase S16 [Tieghemostelium lacteum]|uniref:Lon protease homolog n=1 Tax=Tieghemostelium lacteum TaxID=361077 RepID=A0A151ZEG8_TIELA|nr:peptidase S16 [Tieghemostelium lacteum]|eukprot:KYQ92325.1 peptidase S16 [Tieghemostelium lacteum]